MNLSGAFFMSQAGARAHARTRVGPDREHLLDHRPDRQHRAGQLRRREVRHVRADDARWRARPHRRSPKADKLHENGLNVTVNTVAPGFIETEMLDGVPEKVLEGVKKQIPFARLGRPEEIARVVHFLVRRRVVLHHGAGVGGQRRHGHVVPVGSHEALRRQRPRPAGLPLQLQRGPGLLGPRDAGAARSGGASATSRPRRRRAPRSSSESSRARTTPAPRCCATSR